MDFGDVKARCRLLVRGVVQGVGFRPFVYRAAATLGLAGGVRNTSEGVLIEVEGTCEAIEAFMGKLRSEAPPLARVEDVQLEWMAPAGISGFEIEVSRAGSGASTLIPPDVAVCRACLAEMGNPADRRYRYPFIVCTECGPRFSIIEGVPYDRARTTMRAFEMCPACRCEYEDPGTRRFHAEPNACPRCGPRVWLADAKGRPVRSKDPVVAAARLLQKGQIVAVKGVGGFHLAALAKNEDVVRRLRRLKGRDQKPFAVMAPDLDSLREFAIVSREEEEVLLSPAHPIVLLQKREPFPLAPSLSPGNARVGAMLPYSPLHHLLLEATGHTLVMTSANPCDEPIVRDNDEAIARLSGIADAFLFHNRDILARVDDSVVVWADGGLRMVRRSRGYCPLPIPLGRIAVPVLGVGGDLKNTFCLTRGDEAFPGPHIGDMENAATLAYFEEALLRMCDLLDVRPQVIVHDLHPDYASTRLAADLGQRLFPQARLLALQHHHAHILACLAEHQREGPAIGVAADGTGYGTDGASWGGEVLWVHGLEFRRLAHLWPLPLPGGDRAAKEAWRMAAAALVVTGNEDKIGIFAARWPEVRSEVLKGVMTLCRWEKVVKTTSLGRLFDAVGALLGLRHVNTYEGEVATAVEHEACAPLDIEPYPLPLVEDPEGKAVLDSRPLLESVIRDILEGIEPKTVATRFHGAVIQGFASAVAWASEKTGIRTVALSGGAFQNVLLFEGLAYRLRLLGLEVLTHSKVPCNDGGLCLGQAFAGVLTFSGAMRD